MNNNPKHRSLAEFTIMLAFMISIVAMSTDVMLPALSLIATDLELENLNDSHFTVSSLFLGFAFGQMFVGPLSDSFGRKPIVYISYIIFIVGCLLAIFATSFTVLLIGRVLQGIGAAGPRIICTAIVRDGFEGRAMARIMSFIMAVFIIVPAIAPAIGQGVIYISGWRATFVMLLAMAVISFLWFGLRQPETLPKAARREFSFKSVWSGVVEITKIRTAFGYAITTGFIFGPFLGYLGSAQAIFQETYGAGSYFALYFGMAALAIGSASLLNSALVMRFGMQFLTLCAILSGILISITFLCIVASMSGVPPLWAFMMWLIPTFFCVGILFGNLNALAMEPLGDMAGLGSAFVGATSTIISLPIGLMISDQFSGTVMPLVLGFAIFNIIALMMMNWSRSVPILTLKI
ncbi:multidrug effflux MFS transporter [Amylibacter sp. SFDW26]|uniref:multidrug effflux MFS transporter n=1 Tax=Amylibacter sp. SFDW26 TaxID=2652722 RepID=UPI0012622DCB|nr:multidrug effflux MFS transporter [Amylibacter sp. SFDW26]KAB7614778.1 multidrug effflux MFS transporter [Amylibacter sp. SFDW26]